MDELGDVSEEVQAYVVGIPDNPRRPWYVEELDTRIWCTEHDCPLEECSTV